MKVFGGGVVLCPGTTITATACVAGVSSLVAAESKIVLPPTIRKSERRSACLRNTAQTVAGGSYVTHNAFCPVCSARVYFYQNAFGSRVYFDDLGWPWPKHPCIDNSAYSRSGSFVGGNAIVRRKQGQIAEKFLQRPKRQGWTL